ncbi:MAG TPA: Holliday junction DNA helicase RuvB C-terminal domain-containing protein, partial [Bacillales bacterium]|nr:Holliday junction DNA helicase RuvB C-terminal domain-containing protein [Bacillales bacterium]
RLEYYSDSELEQIIIRTADVLNVAITDEAAQEMSSRSRGTPRIANRLLKRVRDFAQVDGDGEITSDICRKALERLQVDRLGLDEVDHKLLMSIIERFRGGPVGLDTLAASIGEESHTIEDVYEPYLLQIGFLQRTPRGRTVTAGVYEHFRMEVPESFGGSR